MNKLLALALVSSLAFAGSACAGGGCGAPAETDAGSQGTIVEDNGRTRTTTVDHGSRGRTVTQTDSPPRP